MQGDQAQAGAESAILAAEPGAGGDSDRRSPGNRQRDAL